jgi:CheY-like chemotaxis protein
MTSYRDVPPTRNPGVLIIDPTCEARDAVVCGLESRGWAVWLAADPDAAAAIYALHADEIDTALIGLQVPGLDGVLTLVTLREIDESLPCCATAPDAYAAAALRTAWDIPVFTRPPDARALSFTLFEMIAPVGKRASLATA